MALVSKSIDEETTELADAYDSLIAPKKLWRNHNNKLYLALRAFGAGKAGLTDAGIALQNRFNPLYCEESDLYSTAKLMGTDFKHGAGSIVRITITNKDVSEPKVLRAGVYSYRSSSGMVFSFQISDDRLFGPGESSVVMAVSQEKGSFPVEHNAVIYLFRSDNAGIDGAFTFSCEDNKGQLGYEDETPYDFRLRVVHDADRQDHIRELELKIRNLPNIFECNLVFNEEPHQQEYDGIILEPKELLVIISGVPTGDIAKAVSETVIYDTHCCDPDMVIYYENDLYVNGRKPVYYKMHDTTDFSLAVTYQYDRDKITSPQVEGAIWDLFRPYTQMVSHLDVIREQDAYEVLKGLTLPNVKILDANVLDTDGEEVPYLRIPKTRLPHLTGITFEAVDRGGAA